MRLHFALATALLGCATAPAATVLRYDDRAGLDAATAGRTEIDFEDVKNTCIALADVQTGTTVHNVLFTGGLGRLMANGPCSPALIPWKGYVLTARLYNRLDAPSQSTQIARLPGNVLAARCGSGCRCKTNDPPFDGRRTDGGDGRRGGAEIHRGRESNAGGHWVPDPAGFCRIRRKSCDHGNPVQRFRMWWIAR